MTMYRILYKETARRALKKIPKKWQARLVKAIDGLKHEPFQGKKLQGENVSTPKEGVNILPSA